ncbi:hypothetical protein PFFCH_05097 [Plasmodium falciparum FCH/4]|uniref:DUF6832 domain-containing protein n=1 Tax=Plasmodium falciparum FCH/4 TaxID=1036724 RepID=A0A024VH43_PLAFA|nr:hypothetical protein PFFCH_05097 [Plasmodium falciparum FCH/4]
MKMLYKDYIEKEDYPNYNWLIRCFCQLANIFGFNSFWSVKDKEAIHELKLFKYLVYDLIEKKEKIKARHCPRLLYAMCCLDYRCYFLLPTILEITEMNIEKYRFPTLCMISFCLSYLGLTNQSVQFGCENYLSRNYNLIIKILNNLYERREEGKIDSTNFCWSLLSFVMVINNMYEYPSKENSFLPEILKNACNSLTKENIPESGWVQYFLYMTLYCCDVEKPSNELQIKESIPYYIQEYLHLKWLDNILITAQNQGSEKMQLEMENIINKLQLKDFFINLSVGRKIDEQHCFFTSHFYKPLNLCIEYDYFHPIGQNRPLVSGIISLKNRNNNGIIYYFTRYKHVFLNSNIFFHFINNQKVYLDFSTGADLYIKFLHLQEKIYNLSSIVNRDIFLLSSNYEDVNNKTNYNKPNLIKEIKRNINIHIWTNAQKEEFRYHLKKIKFKKFYN